MGGTLFLFGKKLITIKSYKMKKKIIILAAVVTTLFLSVQFTFGQAAKRSGDISYPVQPGSYSESSIEPVAVVNPKVEKNFLQAYTGASEMKWFNLRDKTVMCRFIQDGILHRAFYTTHGHWIGTVSSYDGEKLDRTVRDRVKSIYYNDNIVFAEQIDLAGKSTIYIVEIRDGKSIRKLKVDDEDVVVVKEFAVQ